MLQCRYFALSGSYLGHLTGFGLKLRAKASVLATGMGQITVEIAVFWILELTLSLNNNSLTMILRICLLITMTSLLACLPDKPSATPGAQQSETAPSQTSKPTTNQRQASPQVKPQDAVQSGTVNTDVRSTRETASSSIQKSPESFDQSQLTPATKAPAKQPVKQVKKGADNLPETACQLLTEKFLGELLEVDYQYISTKNASGKAEFQRSCFFRWDQDDTPNAGVLIQVQNNPIADEFPEWAENYIPSKKSSGDNAPDGSVTYAYKNFDGVGVEGAYNFNLARYYWRTSENQICMVAFNLPATEERQVIWARRIAKEVMRNL